MFTILSTCKGGGYRYCRTEPPHPKRNAKGLYPLHRVLMENKLGRLLLPGEVVHHRDEDKTNDAIENLELLSTSEHSRHHKPPVAMVESQCHCGRSIKLKPSVLRRRQKVSKGTPYCSRVCSGRLSSLRMVSQS